MVQLPKILETFGGGVNLEGGSGDVSLRVLPGPMVQVSF